MFPRILSVHAMVFATERRIYIVLNIFYIIYTNYAAADQPTLIIYLT